MKTKGEWTAESKREWDTVVKRYAEHTIPFSIKTLILKTVDGVNFFAIKYRMPKLVEANKRKAYYVYTDYAGLVGIRPKMAGFKAFAKSVVKKMAIRKVEHKKFRGLKAAADLTKHEVLNVADYILFKKGFDKPKIKAELAKIRESKPKLTHYRTAYKRASDRDKYEIAKLYKWKSKSKE